MIADPLPGLRDDLGVLAVTLTARDRAADQAAARKAAVMAVDALDSMLRSLYLIRGRLVREISTADAAAREDRGSHSEAASGPGGGQPVVGPAACRPVRV